MYYSIAVPDVYGKACIGRAEGTFRSGNASSAPSIIFLDSGQPVICSDQMQVKLGGPHAIDPSVMVDEGGRWWMSFGSWSGVGENGGGVWMVELNASTGFLNSAAQKRCRGPIHGRNGTYRPFCWTPNGTTFLNVANDPWKNDNSIEASYLYNDKANTGFYFLFVNYYYCCRGVASNYEIHVGRSTFPNGPFYDRDGVDMAEGGGTLLFSGVSRTANGTVLAGTGHAGVMKLKRDNAYVFSFDYQGIGNSSTILFATQARRMSMDESKWPVISEENWIPTQI